MTKFANFTEGECTKIKEYKVSSGFIKTISLHSQRAVIIDRSVNPLIRHC